jgi:flavodoxin
MKKILSMIIAFSAFLVLFAACSKQPEPEPESSSEPEPSSVEEVISSEPEAEPVEEEPVKLKALVIYFSRTGENYKVGEITEGNTYKVAKEIALQTDAEMFEIRTLQSYPDDYEECVEVAQKERDEAYRPALVEVPDPEYLEGFDEIYLGYPIWCGDMPMAIYTFMEKVDLDGKPVNVFITHEGSRTAGTIETIRRYYPYATLSQPLTIYGSVAQNYSEDVKNDVANWLESIH